MAYNVIITDGKTTVIAACVETLALAVYTSRSFLAAAFFKRIKEAAEDRGIDDELREKRKLWVKLIGKARKMGFGKGVFVQQV